MTKSKRLIALIREYADLMGPMATLHASYGGIPASEHPQRIGQFCKSIEELLPVARDLGFVINVEYLPRTDLGNSEDELLQIVIIRYLLSTNSFKKYMPVTIATNLSEESVAAIMENQSVLQGIEVIEDSAREYVDEVSMGPILGYTGKASADKRTVHTGF